MKQWPRWLTVTAGMALAFVAASAAVQAISQRSWGPVITVGWIPAIVAATWPGSYGRCLPRRGPAGD